MQHHRAQTDVDHHGNPHHDEERHGGHQIEQRQQRHEGQQPQPEQQHPQRQRPHGHGRQADAIGDEGQIQRADEQPDRQQEQRKEDGHHDIVHRQHRIDGRDERGIRQRQLKAFQRRNRQHPQAHEIGSEQRKQVETGADPRQKRPLAGEELLELRGRQIFAGHRQHEAVKQRADRQPRPEPEKKVEHDGNHQHPESAHDALKTQTENLDDAQFRFVHPFYYTRRQPFPEMGDSDFVPILPNLSYDWPSPRIVLEWWAAMRCSGIS